MRFTDYRRMLVFEKDLEEAVKTEALRRFRKTEAARRKCEVEIEGDYDRVEFEVTVYAPRTRKGPYREIAKYTIDVNDVLEE